MPANEEMSLSRWLAIGSPSVVVLGVLCGTILHTRFGVPWDKAFAPAMIVMAIQTVFDISLYSARKRYNGNRDLKLATGLFGICSVITGLTGMRYAEYLGIVGSGTFDKNYRLFSVSVLMSTLIAAVLVGFLRRRL
jgi:hypothetical protein